MSLDRRLFLGGLAITVMPVRAETRAPATLATPPSPKDDGGSDGFIRMEAGQGSIRLVPGSAAPTAVACYGGTVPGPLLRIKKGAELKVRLVNGLDQPTSLCWHGVRNLNAMDGVAGLTQKPVLPGEHFDYRFTPPDSGLFWYHPHVWPFSAAQIGRGLHGVLIVDEVDPPPTDHELLVVIDDWSLDDKSQIKNDFLDLEQAMRAGHVGPLITINTKPAPLTETMKPGSRLRLRLLSVMSARIMFVSFEGAHPMVQAIDGQPCEIFEPVRQTIPIGPGSRFDIMIDMPKEAGRAVTLVLRGGEGEADRPLVLFKTDGDAVAARGPIASLPRNTALPEAIPLERALKMNLVIDGGIKPAAVPAPGGKTSAPVAPVNVSLDPKKLWTINGVASDGFSGRPLFSVKRGTAVSLAFVNKSAFAQQIHLHGHAMRLLHDLDDGWEPYWRDAVLVAENHAKHVAFIADNPGKWVIESLVLDRQDTGLAAWFEVT